MNPHLKTLGRLSLILAATIGLASAIDADRNRLGLVVTNCRTALPDCPAQTPTATMNLSPAQQRQLDEQGADYLQNANSYEVLRASAPPAERGDRSSEGASELGGENSGDITGRVYYFPARAWVPYAGLTLFGLTAWTTAEVLLRQRRSQQRQLHTLKSSLQLTQKRLAQAKALGRREQETKLRAELAAWQQQTDTANQTVEQLRADLEGLQHGQDEAAAEIRRLQRSLRRAQSAADQVGPLEQELINTQGTESLAVAENEELRRENEGLKRDAEGLKREILGLQNRLETRRSAHTLAQSISLSQEDYAIALKATEADLYLDEKRDILLDLLREALSTVPGKSRRFHLLCDLIDCNPASGRRGELHAQVHQTLKAYRSMDSQIEKSLRQMGFDLRKTGKHHKIIFCGDPRYVVTMSKTGSDRRGGLNLVSQIRRHCL